MDLGTPHSPWRQDGGDLPAGELPATSDAVVIGAGIFGATTAMLLAEAGWRVVLIDRADPLRDSTTVNSTVKVTVGQGILPATIARHRGDDWAIEYVHRSAQAMNFIADRAQRAGDCDVARRHQFVYADDDSTAGEVQRTAALLAESGVRLIARPDDVDVPATAEYCVPDQLMLDPAQYLRLVIAAGCAAGVRYVPDVPVTDLGGSDPITVVTAAHPIETRVAIVATQYPFLLRGGLFTALKAERHFGIVARVAGPVGPSMTYRVGDASRSTRPLTVDTRDDRMVIVGEGHDTGTGPATGSRSRERWRDLIDWTSERFGVQGVTHHWAAQDTSTPEGLPMIGPLVPGRSDLLTATGFSGWGMTNGTIGAHQIVNRLLGDDDRPQWGMWPAHHLPGVRTTVGLAQQQTTVAVRLLRGLLRDDGTPVTDLAPGQGVILRRGTSQIAVSCDKAGNLCALSARCTHLGCTVEWNAGESSWDCPCHGSRFAPDGAVLTGPATTPLAALPEVLPDLVADSANK